ncbi:MAG: acyl carrier protein [Actinomycetaceae bacterium]|nr:acyl carrier protein [Actinomycetaceae bacterium]
MGTIGELLGYSFNEPEDSSSEDSSGQLSPNNSAPQETAEERAMAVVLEHTDLDPAAARHDLTLAGDLDLDRIGLWTMVTAIEHSLGVTFPDSDVNSWTTLGDLLASVASQDTKE